MNSKVKIICTIGPSSFNKDVLEKFKDRGVDFFRINLSHTDEEEIESKIIELKKYGVPLIIDTEGSQIRLGNRDEIYLEEGEVIRIHNKYTACDEKNLFFTPIDIISNFKLGDLILVDFNSVLFKVSEVSSLEPNGYIECIVLIGGKIGGRKAVHLDSFSDLPAFSNKDIKAVELAIKHNISTFTLSFIRRKEDIHFFRKLFPPNFPIKFYSKIEVKSAIDELDSILELSDGILIDRGDLSKEIPVEKIPFVQKYIIHQAREFGKEVFVATNTLEKMSSSLKPDKSEANDIVNTLLDGATGIALTKETAAGNYPIETVNMLMTLIDQVTYLNVNERSGKNDIIQKIVEKKYLDSFNCPSLLIKPHGGRLVNRIAINSKDSFKEIRVLVVDEKVIMDAEQIAVGAFSPIEGFMCQNEMNSVLDNMRLPSGIVWPIPIILQLSTENAKKFSIGEKILLVYEEDNLAYCTLVIEDIYKLDKEEIIKKWFGTDNPEHPGVKQIILGGDYAIGGKIELIRKRESPYKLYELAPEQTRRIFSERGWKKVVGFHTRNAIHCSHEFIQMDAMRKGFCDGLFVHPVIGKKKEGDFEPNIIIKSYEKMVNGIYPKGKVVFSAFPTFSRYAGPREAIFTALTRKNFGCSHFIVGRDHTGVGNFYSPTASHEIFDKFSKEELGIIPIKFNKVFYSSTEKNHFHESECPNYPEDKKLHISGTEARKILQEGKMPPEWFMRPEISSLILETLKNKEKVFVGECNSKVIWFTGLSGSGKTTIALELKKRLENLGKKVIILDGDNIRSSLHKHLGFSREDIRENNRLIAEMCKGQKNADFILVPIISPYKQDRESARTLIGKHNFIELFISTPIEECIKRDVKGLYKKAFSGEISNFIGVHGSNPYEPPENPDMKINTLGKTAEECTELIIKFLMAKNFNS